ncbi:uncharacterized protein LOC118092209 isoform X2 [Zootoca vivipara]|uniref:uncharacterized protein LOC118092209 isoform X2 n=1 Tax=Zootoca vivipara TaxID=8524 RepID=UPI00293BF6F9|nr:uncharacterized protein LOC118092209 isoform X2 [Zootoca vivipara]
MKTFGLVLASLFAFAAVGTGQRRPQEEQLFYDPDHFQIQSPTFPPLERSQQEAPKRNVRSVEELPGLQVPREPLRRRFCPGCYTSLEQRPPLEEQRPVRLWIQAPTFPPPERSQQEAAKRNVRSVEELPGVEQSLQDSRESRRQRFCPSCFSPLHQVPQRRPQVEQLPVRLWIQDPTFPPLERSQQSFWSLSFPVKLQEPRSESRTKRSLRGAAPARARAKQRSGTRAVCRGCYSGLMIVAPPAQGSTKETWIGSHSESEGDSSEEVTLPPKA